SIPRCNTLGALLPGGAKSKMSAGAARIIQVVKPHIPLIRFPKHAVETLGTQLPFPPVNEASSAPEVKPSKMSPGVAIEDKDLPMKYRRKLIDDIEIEYINRGGPE
ncbi:unnamed protein product, partial [Owenia fusiformis]